MGMRHDLPNLFALCVDHLQTVHDLRGCWISSIGSYDTLDRLRKQHIISVQENDDLSMALVKARIDRGRLSSILLENRDDPFLIAIHHLAGVVSRTVVDNDHLSSRITLAKCAFNCACKKATIVVVCYDDADQG